METRSLLLKEAGVQGRITGILVRRELENETTFNASFDDVMTYSFARSLIIPINHKITN